MLTQCMLSWRKFVTLITLVYNVHVLAVYMLVHNLSGLMVVVTRHTEPSLHFRVELKQGLNLCISGLAFLSQNRISFLVRWKQDISFNLVENYRIFDTWPIK